MCNFIGIEEKLWYTLLSIFLQRNYLIYSLDLRTKTWVINYPSDLSVDEHDVQTIQEGGAPAPLCGAWFTLVLHVKSHSLHSQLLPSEYRLEEKTMLSLFTAVKHCLAFSEHLFFPTEHLLLLHIRVHKCINTHCSVTRNMLIHPPITA